MAEFAKAQVITLIIALTSVQEILTETCPYDHPNCKCSVDWSGVAGVSCSDLQQLPTLKTGANVSHVSTLSITNGTITTITKDSLPASLKEISLTRLPLTYVSDDAFDNSATTLLILSITGAQFKILPKALTKLSKLMELHVIDTPLTEWDNSTMQQLGTSVRTLELKNVGLSTWPKWLSFFTSLTRLSFDMNSLDDVPGDAFDWVNGTLEELTFVSLANNRLSDSAIGSFPPFISYIILSGNSFSSVPAAIVNMTTLTYLNLAQNQITEIEPGIFPSSIKELDLSSNYLTIINNTAFDKLTNLRRLELKNNSISEISSSAFTYLEALTYLSLTGSMLTEVPLAFASLSNEVNIDMSTGRTLSCPCPAPRDLFEWFTSRPTKTLTCLSCNKTGQDVCSYLRFPCGPTTPRTVQQSTLPSSSVTPLAHVPSATTPSSSATSYVRSSRNYYYYYFIITTILTHYLHHHVSVPSEH
ncbi:hypothetical protein BsWGS_16451 [Bradybaena similaris]